LCPQDALWMAFRSASFGPAPLQSDSICRRVNRHRAPRQKAACMPTTAGGTPATCLRFPPRRLPYGGCNEHHARPGGGGHPGNHRAFDTRQLAKAYERPSGRITLIWARSYAANHAVPATTRATRHTRAASHNWGARTACARQGARASLPKPFSGPKGLS